MAGKKPDLAEALQEEGLEEEFWLLQFAKLGVTSVAALHHQEGDTDALSTLQKEIRYPWEKKALQKLLKIEELVTNKHKAKRQEAKKQREKAEQEANEKKEKEKKDAEKKNQEAKQLFQELKKARADGKDRHDERVQELEKHVHEKLQIAPESWVSSDKSFEELISKLEAQLERNSAALQTRNKLDDAALLQKASGGRALQGVLLTSNLKDRQKERACLLKVPENVSITGASSLKEEIESFSSKHQEDSYRTTIDILGHSIAVSGQVPVYGAVDVGGMSESSRSEEERTMKENKREKYSSTVKYSSIHVATYTFGNKDLKLSDDAREDLKRIIKTVKTASNANVQRACENFFRTYGSHVNQGPLHFGGNFWWTCFSTGFDTEETKTVKKLQSEAVTLSVGVSYAGFNVFSEVSLDSVKGNYIGKCSKSTLASTHLELELDGGPTEASDLSVWKAGLVANNSTWRLTDRGRKLVAVWDVIGKNHQKEFGEVREVLRKAWEEMTGLHSEPDFLPTLKFDSEDVLKEVSEWNEKELTPHELEDNLTFLYEVKEDLLRKVAHPQYWVDEYLSREALQEFLTLVVDSSPIGSIKFLMQQIVEERDLKKLSTCTFPDIEHVSEWLYKSDQPSSLKVDCEDFESFCSYLKKTMDEVKLAQLDDSEPLLGSAGSIHSSSIAVATNVSRAIHSLRSNCQGTYDDILVMILAFPFQNDDRNGVNPLSIQDLKSLLEKFTEEKEKYTTAIAEGVSALQLQSLLFFLAVSIHNRPQEGQFKVHLKKISQMMEVLEPPLEKILKDELNSYLCASYRLPRFKESLNYLQTNGHLPNFDQPPPPPGEGTSLLHVLSTTVAKQSTSKSEHVIPMSQNKAARTLFSKLGLTKHYHEKLGLQDALCIRSEPLKMSLNMSNPTEPTQLPFLVLQKLMSFESPCRGKPDNSTKIHPVDSLLALIICSDHFLRQDVFSRLEKCQLAVPFILPDPFSKELLLPLWAMRSITKEWNCVQTVQGENKVVEQTSPIVKYPMPIVSFMRLGKHQKHGESKSRILNKVISESEHFFCRDLSGGNLKHVLGDGLVDMSWYFPAGKRNDVFPDAVTFLNLHGDACRHPQQSRFLSQISFMCFVLLIEEDLKFDEHTLETLKQFSLSAGGIMLLKDVDKAPETLTNESLSATLIDLKDLNPAGITEEIQKQICVKLFQSKATKTIEECCSFDLALENGIHVDECTEFFQEGLKHANKVTCLVQKGKSIKYNAKEEMLPLQGVDLWRAWGSLNKELHRQEHRGNKDPNNFTAEIETKQASIRSQQHRHVKALTPVMERFIMSLLTLGDRTARNFFLQHLILNLNSLSRERTSELQTQYQVTREEIYKLQLTTGTAESKKKTRKEKAGKLEKCREKLQELKNDIFSASFGLHHLLRELGQVYEAAYEESSKYGDQLSRLPKVAAELFLDGYPLELIDGDAAHVPVKWVQAVMGEVNRKLYDPRMFVLSVLGLQGTGKSTMLNTVFGLKFNTSVGRCTRGAFMQLLPVDETIKAATEYSYVLVIDTEGLRAPELDSSQRRKHDNELATFIIGLAHATFISISGEVAGDLDDILQITVHAFLRMNEVVELDPSCQFIHQNSGASARGQVGRDSFAAQLDKWTLDAAIEESCVGKYEKFSDVIQFDDQKDVHHFPGLWEGDPPMAPVNQGYSHAAQKMKFNLLQMLQREAKSTNVSSFKTKVNDMWGALLRENFVFSFRNTEEITAYNSLGAKFNKWEGAIQAEMLDWEKKATNEINTEKNVKSIPAVVEKKREEIPNFVLSIYNSQIKEMQTFFSEYKLKDTLVQWKKKFKIKLEAVKEEWEAHADNHCVQLGEGRHAIGKFQQDRIKYTAIINSGAQKNFAEIKKEQDELDESLEEKRLDKAQLKKIMKHKHKLFTTEKLSKFREEGILTQQKCCSDLTEDDVKYILIGGVLTPEQAKTVLKQVKHDEKELKAGFDKIWIQLVEKLPPVYSRPVNVEAEVKRKLTGYAKKLEDAVNSELKAKNLRQWAQSLLSFKVEKKHYSIVKSSSWIGKVGHWVYNKFITDLHQNEAQKITDEVFDEARQYFEDLKELKTYFNEAYTLELLQKLDKAIKEKLSTVEEHFTFTRKYTIEVYLTACGYAVVQFEEMAEAFRQQNDPREYLEKYQREPLFTRFKNMYYRTAAEEAFADNLCAALSAPIKAQIEGSLGAKIVGQMRREAYLTDKMALKAKILIDLGTMRDFKKYMTYLTEAKQSLKDWIEHYTIEYCNEEESSDGTQLQVLAKNEVSRIISILGRKVNEVKDEVASKWLSTFCKDLDIRRELGVLLDTSDLLPEIETLDLKNFKEQMRSELRKLEKKLHNSFGKVKCDMKEMGRWQEKPYSLLKTLCGCTEQCPFCGEQCDLGEHSGTTVKHTVAQHRPQCVVGYRDKDQILVLDICPTDVAGDKEFRIKDTDHNFHPYKKYLDKYPNWHIPPDPAAQVSVYWKWFVGQHIHSLASYFKAKAPKVPGGWTEMKWKDAETKLKSHYNL